MIASKELQEIKQRITDSILEIPVKADILRELVADAERYHEMAGRWPAGERDPRDNRMKSESFLTMNLLKHTARKHYGNTFAMMETTVEMLEEAFKYVHLEEYDAAKRIIGALDGGWSSVQADKELEEGELK